MIHIRIVAPPELSTAVLAQLEAIDVVTALVCIPGAGKRPAGDVITCDVPREAGSLVVAALERLGVLERGALSIHDVEAAVSRDARDAEEKAPGHGSDAVVWEALESRTSSSAVLSSSFLVFMIVATLICAIGIVTDSVVLVIGAMVVGPEFGPLAGVCVGIAQRRVDLAVRSLVALAVGFPIAVLISWAVVKALVLTGAAPATLSATQHPMTVFISRPDATAALVAGLASVAGMLSLSTANSGALIGVLISVTTLPAAANLAVAAAYGNGEAVGAAIQLALNVGILLVVGVVTLRVQRMGFARDLAQLLRGRRSV